MKLTGILKILAVLAADFAAAWWLAGIEAAVLVTAGVGLYAWLGEYIALLKNGAVGMDYLQSHERSRLSCAMENLAEDVQRTSGIDISRLKMHVIPTDDMNAYAYGFRNIAVTRAMLNNCDDATLCAVLGHEVSHIVNLDAVFSRAAFASITVLLGALVCMSLVSVSFVWIIFAVLAAFGLCGGLISLFLFKGISKLTKGFFTMLQHGILFFYQAVMAFINRRCEYRADRYSCQLGYGPQLSYFLSRFVQEHDGREKTMLEIIYASHPAVHKRTLRIEACTSL